MTRGPTRLPAALLAAAGDRERGATEIARQAIGGLLEVAGDPARLEAGARALLAGQPAMAPAWRVAQAARAPDPAAALGDLLRQLDAEVAAAAEASAAWLAARGGRVRTVSRSGLVDLVLARLEAAGASPGGEVGLVGADAIGPAEFLNAAGTRALAASVPTLVVATSIKLVPAGVFARLAAPGFERVPLGLAAAVALGGELLGPAQAGRRAAAVPAPPGTLNPLAG